MITRDWLSLNLEWPNHIAPPLPVLSLLFSVGLFLRRLTITLHISPFVLRAMNAICSTWTLLDTSITILQLEMLNSAISIACYQHAPIVYLLHLVNQTPYAPFLSVITPHILHLCCTQCMREVVFDQIFIWANNSVKYFRLLFTLFCQNQIFRIMLNMGYLA